MELFEFLACTILVAISAAMAAAEIALFSLSRFQLRALKDVDRGPHRRIKRLLADPSGLLITILVLNEIVNISLSAIVTDSLSRSNFLRELTLKVLPFDVPGWALDTVFGILFTTPIVLFFCEITPKTIAARANQIVAPLAAAPLAVIYDIAKPIRVVLKFVVIAVAKLSGPAGPRESGHSELGAESPSGGGAGHGGGDSGGSAPTKILKESEFLMMLEEGQKEGEVQSSEVELIKNVFDLDDTTVSEIATPIAQVLRMTEHTTLKTAMQMVRGQKYSRIPISSANRRQIVGVLYTKDLFKAKLDPAMMTQTVSSLMRKPLFVSPQLRLNSLFRKFKQQKTHIAIVQAPHTGGAGGSSDPWGIVTMSDVLDSLLEDVLPEDTEADAGFGDARPARAPEKPGGGGGGGGGAGSPDRGGKGNSE